MYHHLGHVRTKRCLRPQLALTTGASFFGGMMGFRLEAEFGKPYYTYSPELMSGPGPGWRLVLLNSYDMNCIDAVESDAGTEAGCVHGRRARVSTA